MGKFIGETGLTYLWSKIKAVFATKEDVSNKQDALVSGTNIKTINSQSLLGSGNITIEGGGSGEENVIDSISVNGSALTPDADKNVDITIPVTDVTVGGSSVLSSGTAVIPAIPTVPTISTDISADATSDTKTASPKAVKTYADSVAGQSNVIEAITMNGNAVTVTSKTAAIVESDPVFLSSAAYVITSSDITKWNAAAVVADDDGSVTIPDFDAEADTVWHKAQTLSSAQKAQARTNIGAQEALVSGTNIKTINNESLLGSGNITIQGGGGSGVQSDWNETNTTSEAYILNKPNIPSVISAEFSYDSTNEGLVITPTNAAVYDSTNECLTIL